MYSIALGGISIVVAGLINNITAVMILLGVAGFGFNGFETLTMVYVAEISAVRFRNFSTVTLTAVAGFSQILFSGALQISNDWRIITTLLVGAPSLVSLYFCWRHLCETPRYLVTRRRYEDARTVLNLIAVTNNRRPFKFRLDGEMDEESNKALRIFSPHKHPEQQQQNSVEPGSAVGNVGNEHGYIDLFRYGSLRSVTFFLLYIWFFRYLAYYGLNMSLESFGADIYKSFTLAAIVESIACILAGKQQQSFAFPN